MTWNRDTDARHADAANRYIDRKLAETAIDCDRCGYLSVQIDERCPADLSAMHLVTRCDRCGEVFRAGAERAEVASDRDPNDHQIVHVSCMREGEDIA